MTAGRGGQLAGGPAVGMAGQAMGPFPDRTEVDRQRIRLDVLIQAQSAHRPSMGGPVDPDKVLATAKKFLEFVEAKR